MLLWKMFHGIRDVTKIGNFALHVTQVCTASSEPKRLAHITISMELNTRTQTGLNNNINKISKQKSFRPNIRRYFLLIFGS
jgi:hypothetical protein